jgi:hypothetical protein
MLKKFIYTISFLLFSSSALAGLITYDNYILNEDTNIITNNNLEWLQWDETHLMSVDSALAAYSSDGWQLASNQQMSNLFNTFNLASSNRWDADENTSQTITTPYMSGDNVLTDPELQLLTLFGITRTLDFGWWDLVKETGAIFGNDLDNDGLYNLASVTDDYEIPPFMSKKDNMVSLKNDLFTSSTSGGIYGVALVRAVDVPEPSSLALFTLAFIGLIHLRARKN